MRAGCCMTTTEAYAEKHSTHVAIWEILGGLCFFAFSFDVDGSSESEEASASGRRSAMSMYSPFQILLASLAGMGRDTELTITGEVVVGLPVALIAIIGTLGAPVVLVEPRERAAGAEVVDVVENSGMVVNTVPLWPPACILG